MAALFTLFSGSPLEWTQLRGLAFLQAVRTSGVLLRELTHHPLPTGSRKETQSPT